MKDDIRNAVKDEGRRFELDWRKREDGGDTRVRKKKKKKKKNMKKKKKYIRD